MKLRCLAIALALLAAFAPDSWGQSKQSPQSQTQTQEQKAATDLRGTDQIPFVVQPLPTKKTAEIARQEAREAKEKTDSDWWTWFLGVLTIIALFGQLAVFIAQAYLLRGTLVATATAAKAAQVSADTANDSLLVSLRPLFSFETMELRHADKFCAVPHIVFGLKNAGSYDVTVNKVFATISTNLPAALTLTEQIGLSTLDGHAILERGQVMNGNRISSKLLGADEVGEIKRGAMTLRIGFEVRCQDALGNPYTQTYPFIYDASQAQFIRASLVADKK
jgi:hypothetical protein